MAGRTGRQRLMLLFAVAMAHLHPRGGIATTPTGGPDLTFEATLPKSGRWRMYLQFQTGGVLHTAAVTLDVR